MKERKRKRKKERNSNHPNCPHSAERSSAIIRYHAAPDTLEKKATGLPLARLFSLILNGR